MKQIGTFFVVVLSLWGMACAPSFGADGGAGDYVAETEAYRKGRVERLVAPTGWLTVCGFHWLEPGENAVGSADGLPVTLPAPVPAAAGTLDLTEDGEGTRVVLRPAAGVAFTIDGNLVTGPVTVYEDDEDFETPLVSFESVTFWIIPRNQRLAVRVRDTEAEARKNFHGIDFYDIDPAYRVVARLERSPELRSIILPNIMGWVDTALCPGPVVFNLRGEEYRLYPTVESAEDSVFFFLIADSTTGIETYGGGRYIYTDLQPDGTTVIDFNRIYNPPCVFSDFATCGLPPEENHLPIPIRAGEKAYHHD